METAPMSATAPITQDVHTIPRKAPEGPVNLVGLTRESLLAQMKKRASVSTG